MKNKTFTSTFTLPDTLQFNKRPVHCKFTAVWQPPDPEVWWEGWWEAENIELERDSNIHNDIPSIISYKIAIKFDSDWVQNNLDEIRTAISEWCDENYSNTDIDARGDK